jgi:uncharacterized protein (TIGR02284 family)
MMNSFFNPSFNPNMGAYPDPDSDADADMPSEYEGRMGHIWTHGDLVDSLNHLIHVCRDGQEGYLQAAEHVKSAWLQGLFQSFSTQREQFATELTNLVAGLGVEPASGSTMSGALHRTWIDFRTAVSGDGGDDTAILDECERGEDAAKEAYETELNKGLPDNIHHVVLSQYQDILRSHEQVRETRDAFAH